jgi:hypothetical protein
MSLVEDTLNQLLQRGERAGRSGSDRAIQERFDSADSDYWRLPLSERDRAHERFLAAQQAGAVELKWSRQGGEDRPLEIVRLCDLDKLAAFLGKHTVAQSIQQAEAILARWRGRSERVGQILERWRSGKAVRGLSPSSAADFADALRVVDAAEMAADDDQVVRVLSAQLFGDSKRIEHLVRHLDVFTAESLVAPARHWDEVFSPLGLVKEPQPFLMAGAGVLHLSGAEECPVAQPFVGVASKAITGYRGAPAWILTIENLTTFHMATSALKGRSDGLVIYTGGMPSPAWARAYRSILRSLPADVPAYHWGDVDVGGFRIAAHIRRHVEAERDFLPWLMMDIAGHSGSREADSFASNEMSRLAKQAGWNDLGDQIFGSLIEQESLVVTLPSSAKQWK